MNPQKWIGLKNSQSLICYIVPQDYNFYVDKFMNITERVNLRG